MPSLKHALAVFFVHAASKFYPGWQATATNASVHRAETIRRDTTQINYTDSQALFFYYSFSMSLTTLPFTSWRGLSQ